LIGRQGPDSLAGLPIFMSAPNRLLVSSGSPFEPVIGFSRAVRVGDRVLVSGTAPIAADGSVATPGDAHGQTKRCLEIIATALEKAGASIDDVVRTRMFLTSVEIWEEVGRAHGEFFREVRPASTMAVVAALLNPEWLVEIEAEAVIGAGAKSAPGD
jgi:enamine deaminase RidA (YjgF/YER057c/UK114 family)